MAKLSIVIPNYNHSQWLAQSIESALNQTNPADEVLIIDDGSQDNSPDIIKKYENHKNVRIICRKENKGTNYTINEGLKVAQGDFILFLAADDFLDPRLVSEYRSFLEKHPDVGFCCSLSHVLLENGGVSAPKAAFGIPSGYIAPGKAKTLIYKYSIWPWFWGNTMMLNRKKVIEMGSFNPDFESFSDGFLYIRLALSSGLVFIPHTLATYRKRADSYSSRVVKDINKLTLIEERVIAVMESCPDYFDRAFIKRWQNRWRGLKYIHHCLGQDHGLLVKFIYAALIFLRYQWFDLGRLSVRAFRSFFREANVNRANRRGIQ